MLDVPLVREILKEMVLFVRANVAGASTMAWRRGDQLAAVPTFPFLLYEIGDGTIEGSQSNIITQRTNQADDTKIDKTTREASKFPITILAVDKVQEDLPFNIIKKAKHWFKTQEGRDFCNARGFVPRIINQSIPRTSNFRNTTYLPRVGFEIRLDFQSIEVDEISRVDTIGLEIDTGLPGDPEEKVFTVPAP